MAEIGHTLPTLYIEEDIKALQLDAPAEDTSIESRKDEESNYVVDSDGTNRGPGLGARASQQITMAARSDERFVGRSIMNELSDNEGGPQITCFSQLSDDDAALHFEIIRLPKQIFAWIGCNSTKFGHLYAAAPIRPSNTVGMTSLIGGTSDNTGSGIARRLVTKTGLNIILACNIPKNSPMLEANAEKILIQKLVSLGYTKPRS